MNDPPVILVVDDEQANLQLMEMRLSPKGYTVRLARDGLEALAQVESDPPDIVLLDLRMPNLDGFEVARKLKGEERYRGIPIVVISASDDEESRVKAIKIGVDDFLSKPVRKTELFARVASLIKVKAYSDHMKNYQAELEAEVAHRTRQLEAAYEKIKSGSLETIHRLTQAAEYKDEDTGQHIQRMSNYSVVVAQALGLSEKTAERIRYAAPLHDIGKIGIPDRILLKPGKLDDAEWNVMKQHTIMGAGILDGSEISFLRLGAVIAMTHHEKWDGSGYPKGLAGNAIPRVGQIVAIADVFDALTTKRPYKDPFPIEKAFRIIKESRGSHFDADVVDALFQSEEEILFIRAQYRDEDESRFLKIAGRVW